MEYAQRVDTEHLIEQRVIDLVQTGDVVQHTSAVNEDIHTTILGNHFIKQSFDHFFIRNVYRNWQSLTIVSSNFCSYFFKRLHSSGGDNNGGTFIGERFGSSSANTRIGTCNDSDLTF